VTVNASLREDVTALLLWRYWAWSIRVRGVTPTFLECIGPSYAASSATVFMALWRLAAAGVMCHAGGRRWALRRPWGPDQDTWLRNLGVDAAVLPEEWDCGPL
jgi:hypothetical protein